MEFTMKLGQPPEPLLVRLTTGADFLCTLRLNEPWPTGTSLTLNFGGGSSWLAVVSGAEASFNVDKAQADAVGNGETVRLVYANGETDQVFASGKVVRNG